MCYQVTEQLPKHETYALGGQIRRSSISIPSNIAEGCKRHNRREFYQFCGIANGSAAELETQLLLVGSLYSHIGIVDPLTVLEEVQKMLTKLTPTIHYPLFTPHLISSVRIFLPHFRLLRSKVHALVWVQVLVQLWLVVQ